MSIVCIVLTVTFKTNNSRGNKKIKIENIFINGSFVLDNLFEWYSIVLTTGYHAITIYSSIGR